MPKQLNQRMNFQIDVSQARQQLKLLQAQMDALTNTSGFSRNFQNGLTSEIMSATKAATLLKTQLTQAINPLTGNLNLTKFNDQLMTSQMNLKDYKNQLSALGTAGNQAFNNLARSIATAETPLLRTSQAASAMWTALGNAARWTATSTAIHGIMSTAASAMNYVQNLDKSLNDIRIVTGQTQEQMSTFAVQANEAAKALNTTTNQYAKAALIYYQQGLSNKQVQERTETTIKLANASGQSAAKVSDQMTAIWNNFYDGSKSLEYYADVITALGATTASSSEEIARGLSKFSSIAQTTGLSYEYATSALSTIVAATRQSADSVGTSLKTLFSRFQGLNLGETLDDGTSLNKYSKALNTVGVSVLNANGELRNMDSILSELGSKWQNLSKAQQAALAQTIGGTRGYTTLMSLMDNWDSFQDNLETATSAQGTLNAQAAIYAESWEAASKHVRAASETIYKNLLDDNFFKGLTNGLGTVLDGIGAITNGLGGFKGTIAALGNTALQIFGSQIGGKFGELGLNARSLIMGQQDVIDLKTQARESLREGIAFSNYDQVNRLSDFYNKQMDERSLKYEQLESQGKIPDYMKPVYQSMFSNINAMADSAVASAEQMFKDEGYSNLFKQDEIRSINRKVLDSADTLTAKRGELTAVELSQAKEALGYNLTKNEVNNLYKSQYSAAEAGILQSMLNPSSPDRVNEQQAKNLAGYIMKADKGLAGIGDSLKGSLQPLEIYRKGVENLTKAYESGTLTESQYGQELVKLFNTTNGQNFNQVLQSMIDQNGDVKEDMIQRLVRTGQTREEAEKTLSGLFSDATARAYQKSNTTQENGKAALAGTEMGKALNVQEATKKQIAFSNAFAGTLGLVASSAQTLNALGQAAQVFSKEGATASEYLGSIASLGMSMGMMAKPLQNMFGKENRNNLVSIFGKQTNLTQGQMGLYGLAATAALAVGSWALKENGKNSSEGIQKAFANQVATAQQLSAEAKQEYEQAEVNRETQSKLLEQLYSTPAGTSEFTSTLINNNEVAQSLIDTYGLEYGTGYKYGKYGEIIFDQEVLDTAAKASQQEALNRQVGAAQLKSAAKLYELSHPSSEDIQEDLPSWYTKEIKDMAETPEGIVSAFQNWLENPKNKGKTAKDYLNAINFAGSEQERYFTDEQINNMVSAFGLQSQSQLYATIDKLANIESTNTADINNALGTFSKNYAQKEALMQGIIEYYSATSLGEDVLNRDLASRLFGSQLGPSELVNYLDFIGKASQNTFFEEWTGKGTRSWYNLLFDENPSSKMTEDEIGTKVSEELLKQGILNPQELLEKVTEKFGADVAEKMGLNNIEGLAQKAQNIKDLNLPSFSNMTQKEMNKYLQHEINQSIKNQNFDTRDALREVKAEYNTIYNDLLTNIADVTLRNFQDATLDGTIDIEQLGNQLHSLTGDLVYQDMKNLYDGLAAANYVGTNTTLALQELAINDRSNGLGQPLNQEFSNEFRNLLKDFNFERSLTGIQSNIQLERLSKNTEAYQKMITGVIKDMGGEKGLFEKLYSSSGFESVMDKLRTQFETTGQITAQNIDALAKKQEDLNALINIGAQGYEGANINSAGIASTLEGMVSGAIGTEDITSSLISALSTGGQTEAYNSAAFQVVDNLDLGRSNAEFLDYFRDIGKAYFSLNKEGWGFNNDQFKTMVNLLGNKEIKDAFYEINRNTDGKFKDYMSAMPSYFTDFLSAMAGPKGKGGGGPEDVVNFVRNLLGASEEDWNRLGFAMDEDGSIHLGEGMTSEMFIENLTNELIAKGMDPQAAADMASVMHGIVSASGDHGPALEDNAARIAYEELVHGKTFNKDNAKKIREQNKGHADLTKFYDQLFEDQYGINQITEEGLQHFINEHQQYLEHQYGKMGDDLFNAIKKDYEDAGNIIISQFDFANNKTIGDFVRSQGKGNGKDHKGEALDTATTEDFKKMAAAWEAYNQENGTWNYNKLLEMVTAYGGSANNLEEWIKNNPELFQGNLLARALNGQEVRWTEGTNLSDFLANYNKTSRAGELVKQAIDNMTPLVGEEYARQAGMYFYNDSTGQYELDPYGELRAQYELDSSLAEKYKEQEKIKQNSQYSDIKRDPAYQKVQKEIADLIENGANKNKAYGYAGITPPSETGIPPSASTTGGTGTGEDTTIDASKVEDRGWVEPGNGESEGHFFGFYNGQQVRINENGDWEYESDYQARKEEEKQAAREAAWAAGEQAEQNAENQIKGAKEAAERNYIAENAQAYDDWINSGGFGSIEDFKEWQKQQIETATAQNERVKAEKQQQEEEERRNKQKSTVEDRIAAYNQMLEAEKQRQEEEKRRNKQKSTVENRVSTYNQMLEEEAARQAEEQYQKEEEARQAAIQEEHAKSEIEKNEEWADEFTSPDNTETAVEFLARKQAEDAIKAKFTIDREQVLAMQAEQARIAEEQRQAEEAAQQQREEEAQNLTAEEANKKAEEAAAAGDYETAEYYDNLAKQKQVTEDQETEKATTNLSDAINDVTESAEDLTEATDDNISSAEDFNEITEDYNKETEANYALDWLNQPGNEDLLRQWTTSSNLSAADFVAQAQAAYDANPTEESTPQVTSETTTTTQPKETPKSTQEDADYYNTEYALYKQRVQTESAQGYADYMNKLGLNKDGLNNQTLQNIWNTLKEGNELTAEQLDLAKETSESGTGKGKSNASNVQVDEEGNLVDEQGNQIDMPYSQESTPQYIPGSGPSSSGGGGGGNNQGGGPGGSPTTKPPTGPFGETYQKEDGTWMKWDPNATHGENNEPGGYVPVDASDYDANPEETSSPPSTPPQPGGCFAPGTKILMANGENKNIEDIKVNEFVIAYDEKTKKFISKKVTKSYIHHNTPQMVRLTFNTGDILELTPGHPLYSTSGWKSLDIANSLWEHNTIATFLQKNDTIININQNAQVIDIEYLNIGLNYDSYNIEVEECHTFLASGFVAHNRKTMAVGQNNARILQFAAGKEGEIAVTGELGPELRVKDDGSMDIVGQHGREYVWVNPNDRIYTAAQTASILGNHSIEELQAFAEGFNNKIHGYFDRKQGTHSDWPASSSSSGSSSPSSGGGGNKMAEGSSLEPLEPVDPRYDPYTLKERDILTRYFTILQQIDDITRAVEHFGKVADRAWGQERIKAIEKQTSLYEEQLAAQKKYVNEIERYLEKDRKALETMMSEFAHDYTYFGDEGAIDPFDLTNMQEYYEKQKQGSYGVSASSSGGGLKNISSIGSNTISSSGEEEEERNYDMAHRTPLYWDSAEFDQHGVLTNYSSLINAMIDAYNNNAWANGQSKEAQYKFQEMLKDIQMYTDTLNLYEQQKEALWDLQNAILDSKILKVVYEVQYQNELDVNALREINYEFGKVRDNVYRAAEAVDTYSLKMDYLNKSNGRYVQSINDILATYSGNIVNGEQHKLSETMYKLINPGMDKGELWFDLGLMKVFQAGGGGLFGLLGGGGSGNSSEYKKEIEKHGGHVVEDAIAKGLLTEDEATYYLALEEALGITVDSALKTLQAHPDWDLSSSESMFQIALEEGLEVDPEKMKKAKEYARKKLVESGKVVDPLTGAVTNRTISYEDAQAVEDNIFEPYDGPSIKDILSYLENFTKVEINGSTFYKPNDENAEINEEYLVPLTFSKIQLDASGDMTKESKETVTKEVKKWYDELNAKAPDLLIDVVPQFDDEGFMVNFREVLKKVNDGNAKMSHEMYDLLLHDQEAFFEKFSEFTLDNVDFQNLTAETVTQLENTLDQVNTTLETIQSNFDTVLNTIGDSVKSFAKRLNTELADFDYFGEIINTYQNIVNLTDRRFNNFDSTFIRGLQSASLDNSINKLKSSKDVYDSLLKQQQMANMDLEMAQAQLAVKETLRANMTDEEFYKWEKDLQRDIDLYEDNLKLVADKANEAHKTMTKNWQDALQKATEAYSLAIDEAMRKYNESFSPYFNTLELLQAAFDREKTLENAYIDDYQRIHDLSALDRAIQDSILDTDNLKSKERLRDMQKEINKLQAEGNKLSAYDLDVLEKKYQVELARQALEDAKQSKSIVRLARDNNGNWSYVYTSSEEEIDEAEQHYEDAIRALEQLNEDYADNLESQLMGLFSSTGEALHNLDRNDFDNEQDFFKAREDIINNSLKTAEYLTSQMNNVFGNNDWLNPFIEDRYGQNLHNLTNDWNDLTAASLLGINSLEGYKTLLSDNVGDLNEDISKASEEFSEKQAEVYEAADVNITDAKEYFNEGIDNILTQSSEQIDNIAAKIDRMEKAFEETMNSVVNYVQKYYEKMYNITDQESYVFLSLYKNAIANLIEISGEYVKPEQLDFTSTIDSEFELNEIMEVLREYGKVQVSDYNSQGERQIYTLEQGTEETAKILAQWQDNIDKRNAIKLGTALDTRDEYNKVVEYLKNKGQVYLNIDGDVKKLVANNEEDMKWLQEMLEKIKAAEEKPKLVIRGDDYPEPSSGPNPNDPNANVQVTRHTDSEGNVTRTDVHIPDNPALDYYTDENGKYHEDPHGLSGLYTGRWQGTPFDTGGYTGMYTGEWDGGSERRNGRLAWLHQKELVLNAHDTENFLDAMNIVRQLDNLASWMANGLGDLFMPRVEGNDETLEQNVHIEASFPNAVDHNEIEQAFGNLVNLASQYANRKAFA